MRDTVYAVTLRTHTVGYNVCVRNVTHVRVRKVTPVCVRNVTHVRVRKVTHVCVRNVTHVRVRSHSCMRA